MSEKETESVKESASIGTIAREKETETEIGSLVIIIIGTTIIEIVVRGIGIEKEIVIGKERGIVIVRGKGTGNERGLGSRGRVEAIVPKGEMVDCLAKGLRIGSKRGRRNDPVCVYKL